MQSMKKLQRCPCEWLQLKNEMKKKIIKRYTFTFHSLFGQIRNTRARAEKKSDKFCWIINILRRFYISRLFGVWVDAWFFGRLDVWVYAWSLCIILHDLDWVITFNVWAAVFMRYYNEIDARARTSRMKWREKKNQTQSCVCFFMSTQQ